MLIVGQRIKVIAVGIVLIVASVAAGPAARAAGHTVIVTFIRHGLSTANAAGIVDTSVPGPDLTAMGEAQAQQVSDDLAINNYDGIWASTMVRTQETAGPMSRALDEPVSALAGLREIDAGANEGLPVDTAPINSALEAWLDGNRSARSPGAISGNDFEARFNDAMNTIYRSGETNPVVFSHGLAIQYWVLMNVKNPDPTFRPEHTALRNTAHVVVSGSPTQGWTLVDWDGLPVSD